MLTSYFILKALLIRNAAFQFTIVHHKVLLVNQLGLLSKLHALNDKFYSEVASLKWVRTCSIFLIELSCNPL